MRPELPDLWPKFLQEAKELKALRNKIVHSDPSGLPTLSDLYERFHRANTLLRPFGFVGSTSRDKFSAMEWKGDHLHFKINAPATRLTARISTTCSASSTHRVVGKCILKKESLLAPRCWITAMSDARTTSKNASLSSWLRKSPWHFKIY